MSLKGKVKWFNGNIEYGFIEREDKEKDVFVHHRAFTFEVENSDKGPSAVNLQKV
jgi:CspA family cold shock protein